MNELLNMGLDKMAGLNYECSCGCTHSVKIENIVLGCDVLNKLLELMDKFMGKRVFILEDKNTYKAAGEQVEALLKENFKISKYMFKEDRFHPDEKALGRIIVEIPEDTSMIIAVGSGTINDISRFIGYKLHISYIIVCTAPSMDGYASVVSPLIIDGVKTTYDAVYPYAIVADINIMKEAPMYMLQAGLGDIIGKYTALADWHIAKILNKEYFCNSIEELMLKAIDKCVKGAVRMQERDTETIESITEALILSGLAIGMVGASRPASGEEHHLSHCWEMIFLDNGKNYEWLHGNNVGVGVGIIIEAYKYLSKVDIQKVYETGEYKNFNREKWTNNLTKVYGKSTGKIIEFKEGSIAFDEKEREKNILRIIANWNSIKEICDSFLPEADTVRNILKECGAVYSPDQLGLDKELFRESFIAAKDVRKRYGVLQLLEDIGKLEEAAEFISDIYYN